MPELGPGIGDTDDFNNSIKDLEDIGIDPEGGIDGTRFKWKDALYLHKWNKYAIPDPVQQTNIIKQAHAIEPVFYMLGGFDITSWLRPKEYNSFIGGAKNSSHIAGLATDFVPLNISVDKAKDQIKTCNIYPGGGEINTTNWIHLDLAHKAWFTA